MPTSVSMVNSRLIREGTMLARLIAYTSETSRNGTPIRRFDVETHDIHNIVIESVISIAGANRNGALHRLCRAIRNAKPNEYERLIGVEFHPD